MIAAFVERLFVTQNYLVSLVSPRWAQRIRCSRILGHFHKWYLGDGEECWYCKQCRNHLWLQKLIPYRWEYVE